MENYNDIINLQHHVSDKHPQMTIEARSAQFAPFSALTGYEDNIKETARITNSRIELDEESIKALEYQFQKIKKQLINRPKVQFTYFIQDTKKDGGKYVNVTGIIKKIDQYNEIITLEEQIQIPIRDIIYMEIKKDS